MFDLLSSAWAWTGAFSPKRSMPEEPRKKVIFLDIDGVMALLGENAEKFTDAEWREVLDNVFKGKPNFRHPKFNSQAVKNLMRLCTELNAEIVITSKWADYPDFKNDDTVLQRFFTWGNECNVRFGDPYRIEDVTDATMGNLREESIKEYCRKKGLRPEDCIILDDIQLHFNNALDARFVKIDGNIGLACEQAFKKAWILLGGDPNKTEPAPDGTDEAYIPG